VLGSLFNVIPSSLGCWEASFGVNQWFMGGRRPSFGVKQWLIEAGRPSLGVKQWLIEAGRPSGCVKQWLIEARRFSGVSLDPFHCWSVPKPRPLCASQIPPRTVTFLTKRSRKEALLTVLQERWGLGGPVWALPTRFTVGFCSFRPKLPAFLTVLSRKGGLSGLYPRVIPWVRIVVSVSYAPFCHIIDGFWAKEAFYAPWGLFLFPPVSLLDFLLSPPAGREYHPFHCWWKTGSRAACCAHIRHKVDKCGIPARTKGVSNSVIPAQKPSGKWESLLVCKGVS